jgi:chondroitin 4-sulfotransferase 11
MRNVQNPDNFIFIHINKTGGSSIEKALNLPFEHKTALEKIEEIGHQQWESKFTFSVIRNPWDKVVSHYHYRVQTNQTGLGAKTIGFKEWVKLSYGNKDPFYYDQPRMFMPQFDWLADEGGRVLVGFICRFENLDDDFNVVCSKIGRRANLPHLKASQRGNYRDYYNEETIEIVARWFCKDIESFGYTF